VKRHISIACNWDWELLEFVKGKEVYSMYGKLRDDFLGGGRAPHNIKELSLNDMRLYIDQLHKNDIKFIYLINSTCNGNLEYSIEFENWIVPFVKKLLDCGVDLFCVANPFTVKLLKRIFPEIKIEVSTLAFVETPAQAKFWDDLGVTEICVWQSVNHDLEMIRTIKNSIKAKLKILVNDPCIINCPIAHFHANYWSHSKVTDAKVKDYCNLYCSRRFIENPAEIIKSSFLLPEDLHLYEEAGVSHFKIVDRLMTTDFLIRAYNAYTQKNVNRNVYELFPFYEKLRVLVPDFEIMMESKSLVEIREHIRRNNCKANCGSICNYCNTNSKDLYSSRKSDKVLDLIDREINDQ
jgi:collagenase-like PrtC family protease